MAEATSKTSADSSTAGVGAHTFESRQVNDDIGTNEAYKTNLKRVVDDFAHLSLRVHGNDLRATDNMQRILEQDWAARLADERVAMKSFVNSSANSWNNLTDEEKRVMAQETRHHDLAVDRQWNIDEQGQMALLAIREIVTSGNLNTDALAAAVKAVLEGMAKK